MADLTKYKIYQNNKFEVLTDTGFQDFRGIIIGQNRNKVVLTFKSKNNITFKFICTPKHKLVIQDKIVYAKDIKIGTDVDGNILLNKKNIKNDEKVYELLNVEGGYKYFCNNMLSKNCLIIDEMSHIPEHIMGEFWNAVVPVVSSALTTKIFVVSCVTKDTFIITDKGIQQIQDFIQDDKGGAYSIAPYKVLGMNNLRSGDLVFNNGRAPTKIIKTKSTELECSLEHKLYVYKNNKLDWVKTKDLDVDDEIMIQTGMNTWGNNDDVSTFIPTENNKIKNKFRPKNITPDMAYFMGLYVAEGCTYKKIKDGRFVGGVVTITTGDDANTQIRKLNIPYYNNGLRYNISSKHLVEFFEYIGFNFSQKATNKTIPSRLLQMSRENMIALLQGLFDGDGFCTKTKGRVGFTSTSKELINQVRMILNNFGITTSYQFNITPPTKKCKVSSARHSIELSGHNSYKYLTEIGFRIKRKQDSISMIQENIKTNTSSLTPFTSEELLKEVKSLNMLMKEIKQDGFNLENILYNQTRKKRIPKETLARFVEKYKDKISESFLEKYNKFCNENIVWEKIKSIKDSENEVYDFSLPHNEKDEWCHSVIYNGMVGHQTPNGTGNLFHQIYTQAERGELEQWHHERIDWHEIPGRGKKWKLSMEQALVAKGLSWDQEFGNCASGENYIDISLSNSQSKKEKRIKMEDLWRILAT